MERRKKTGRKGRRRRTDLGVVGVGSVDDGGAAEDGDRDADQVLFPERLCARNFTRNSEHQSAIQSTSESKVQHKWVESAAHLSDDERREKDVGDEGDHAQGGDDTRRCERVREKVAQLAAVHQPEPQQPEFVAEETLVEAGSAARIWFRAAVATTRL